MKNHSLKLILLISCLFSITFSSVAQRSKVTSGAMAYGDGEYEKAIQYFQEALAKPDLLDSKDLAKAYAKLGQSYMGLYTTKKPKTVNDYPFSKYPNLLNDAWDAFQKAKQYDELKKFETEINAILPTLGDAMYRQGFDLYKAGKYTDAESYLTASCKIFDATITFYGSYTLRGYNYLELKDTVKATKDFEKALELYKAKKPKTPDNSVAYVYVALATIYEQSNPDKSLKVLAEAKTEFPQEKVINDTELNLYLRNKDLYDKGILRFEEEVKKQPNNEQIILAYAQLTERKDVKKAIEIYKQVLQVNPKNTTANYNIGANLVNQAAELVKKANDSKDGKEISALNKEIMALMKEAYKYMKAAYDADPKDISTVDALVQITTTLGNEDDAMMAESAKYIKIKNELKANKK
ncbi:MAG: hypothetical protein LC115_08870 [Bacteroidia bacterium]|nr:hypothetical protein [Bacteroidia bacterium]